MARTNYAVEIAKMKKDIEYIKNSIDEFRQEFKDIYKEIQEKKADKEELFVLKEDYNSFKNKVLWGFISVLVWILAVIIRFIIENFFK